MVSEILGVRIKPLLRFPDERGTVKHFMKNYEWEYPFGEVYVTTIYRGIIKGWHGYQTKTMAYAVVKGAVKLVLYDNREDSSTYDTVQEIILGDDNYQRVIIPPSVYNAFRGIADESIIVVLADEPFNEETTYREPPEWDKPKYDWTRINR